MRFGGRGNSREREALEGIAAGNLGAVEHAGLAGGSADILEVIEVRLQVLVGDRKIRDGHALGDEFRAIALFQIAAQIEVFAQRPKVATRPMRARAADARARFESNLSAGRARRCLLVRVARGDGFLRQALQELAMNGSFQFIHDTRGRRNQAAYRDPDRAPARPPRRPASVSSFAMIAPVQPIPTMTASTFGLTMAMDQPRLPARSTGGSG